MTTTPTYKSNRRGRPTKAVTDAREANSFSFDRNRSKLRKSYEGCFPKIAFYRRISQLTTESVTFERQDMEVLRHLKNNYGLDPELGNCEIVYFDEEGSAYKNRVREVFDEMIHRIIAGEFTHLAAYEFERLFRNTDVTGYVTPILKNSGIKISILSLPSDFDLDSMAGKIQWEIAAIMAENESRKISKRVAGSHEVRVPHGVKRGGYDPLGLRTVKTTETSLPGERSVFAVDDEPFYSNGWSKADLVREIFKRVTDGQTVSSVMTWMNAQGFPCPQGGEFWTSGHVQRIVTNPIYTGTGVYKRQPNVDPKTGEWIITHEPLIDRDTFDRACVLVKGRKRKVSMVTYSTPLSGVLFCGECGHRLYNHTAQSRKQSYRAFRCNTTSLDKTKCPGIIINAEGLEETIYDVTLDILSDPELAKKLTERLAAVESVEPSQRELDLKAEIAECYARAEKETDAGFKKMFLDKAAEQEAELVAISTRANAALTYAKNMRLAKKDTFIAAWNEQDKSNAQLALQGLYSRILISKSAQKYNWKTMRARGWKTDLNRITLEFVDGTVVKLADFVKPTQEEEAAA